MDEILNVLGLPISRRNEIDLGMGLRRTFGDGILGKALAKRVRDSKHAFIIINGIRFQDELENARDLGARIIYITAPEELRFKRFLKRKEKTDDASQNIAEFRLQEHEPTEIGIPSLGAQADEKIENAGTVEDLYSKIDRYIKHMQK